MRTVVLANKLDRETGFWLPAGLVEIVKTPLDEVRRTRDRLVVAHASIQERLDLKELVTELVKEWSDRRRNEARVGARLRRLRLAIVVLRDAASR